MEWIYQFSKNKFIFGGQNSWLIIINAFISAKKWLEEYNFDIILYLESPVQAIGL